MSKTEINKEEINSFFSQYYYFSSSKNIDSYIYSSLGKKIISERERSKIILKLSFSSIDNQHGIRFSSHVHPLRFFATRLMKIIKGADTATIMRWMNSLQANDSYRADLIKSIRISGMRLNDKWQSCFCRIWSTPYGLNWKFKNVVVILPDMQTTKDFMHLDNWRKTNENAHYSCPASSKRYFHNKNGTYPFSLMLDLDELSKSVLEG